MGDVSTDEFVDPCAEVDCGSHGHCEVGVDGPVCVCDDGYVKQGDDCVEPPPDNPCEGVTCSGHGRCELTDNNEASCVCDRGYNPVGTECVKVSECGTTVTCSGGWCLIPACSFQMGSPNDEPCRNENEGPVHTVKISRPFYMKETQVTQKEWFSLIGNKPANFKDCGDECPVDSVNWYDAVYYANKLSEQQGLEACYTLTETRGTPGEHDYFARVSFAGLSCKGYRLPTEAEWEYATRAGTKTAYWIGTNIGVGGEGVCESDASGISLIQAGWIADNSEESTHPVKLKDANPWGLYDVHGNVFEWVNDRFDSDYYGTCQRNCVDPLGPSNGSDRVARGGSWLNSAKYARSAYRELMAPANAYYNVGIRLVRTAQ